MLKSSIFLPFVLIVNVVATAQITDASRETKEKAIVSSLVTAINALHYQPKPLDDAFSKEVYNLYLKRLDGNKKFFLESDIDQFAVYQNKIDDELQQPSLDFFKLVNERYQQRVLEMKESYPAILNQPFDFTTDETFVADGDKLPWCKTKSDLVNEWRKSLKYQVLTRIVEAKDIQDKQIEKKDTSLKVVKTWAQLEEDARTKVAKSQKDFFERLAKNDEDDYFSLFANTITAVYDPHTYFFPPKDKESFDIRMSGKLEGIGATLQEKDNYIKITSLVVGGPAWKEGHLKAEDLILKVKEQKDADWFSLEDVKVDEAVSHIRGKKGTVVNLTVKHIAGNIEEISITRDVVVFEDTYAKSAIIKDGDKKIGFIYLPEFYVDFNNPNGRRCSTDMRKEIEKLNKDQVDAIIIDLRNNGGGSLSDVVEIGGLFIKSGPVVQVSTRDQNQKLLFDHDPNQLYAGPVAVMVNEFSASASEILAAALQDYHRAIIVGSTSTFGKGTVQSFYNLDDMLSAGASDLKPIGSIKVTNQKFFRIDGGSTQLKGVSSDIVLPDVYSEIDLGEKKEDYPLKWTQIRSADYTPYNYTYDISELKKNSKNRLAQNQYFSLVSETAKSLKKDDAEKSYTINYDKYLDKQQATRKRNQQLDEIQKQENNLTIVSLTDDAALIEADTNKISKRNNWFKTMHKDAYLFETVQIMKEAIDADRKNKAAIAK